MSFEINRNNLIHGLDLTNQSGIEIGPLVNPIVRPEMGDIKYVDRASTEDLRKWYSRDDKLNINDIMDIDFIWGEQGLVEATGGREQFDYCIASHVIEHIPDLITWLGEIASILKVGGLACFAVPDKRYTFDCRRPVTTSAELVDCYLNKLRKPTFKHIYDHFSNHVEVDINQAWDENFDPQSLHPAKSAKQTFAACLDTLNNDKYVDSHCSVFTEASFFELLSTIAELGLLDFRIKRNFSVRRGMFEFFVQLEKIDSSLSDNEKFSVFKESLDAMRNCGLSMLFTSTIECTPKLYFSHGDGFNEIESIEASYSTPNIEKQLYFGLPQMNETKLRFDPSDREARFEMSELFFNDGVNKRELASDSVVPLQDIAGIDIIEGKLIVTAAEASNDPAVLIQI